MKTKAKVLLIVSFGLNMALLANWWVGRTTPQNTTTDQPKDAKTVADTRPSSHPRPTRFVETVTVDREGEFEWANVESQDYKEYIANLRSITCPEETIHDIIIADVNKLYASKIAALYPSPKDFKFWRVGDRTARNEERDRDEKRHALDREKRELIKELLGVDYDAELARWSGKPDEDDWRYGFLPAEKQDQVRAISNKYREMERSIWNNGGNNSENRAKYMAMRAQREAELAQLLGPQEFEEYMLRNSWTARNMRENLTSFQPDEKEFRELFQIRKAFDDQFGFTRDGSDEAVREQRRLAQQQMEEQMRTLLGDARFHEYQISQDDRYREAFDFGQRYNLPRETTEIVYNVRKAAEDERRRIQSDATLTAEAQKAALTALADDTKKVLGDAFGPKIFPEYERRNGWLGHLSQMESDRRDRWKRN